MTTATADNQTVAPRTAGLLPIAYLLHLAEEWFGGFSAWTRTALGFEVSEERFLLINGIALLVFVSGTLAALRYRRMAWFAASLAALLGLNGILHTLASVGLARYSPGTITGLLIYIPLSVIVLRLSSARLATPVFAGAIVFGVALHGVVYVLARL